MKKIVVLRNTGADLPRFIEGQVVDVKDEVAELLCGLNLAKLLQTIPPETIKAIPPNPSIVAAEAKLQEIKDGWLAGADAENTAEAPQPPPKRPSKTKPEFKE